MNDRKQGSSQRSTPRPAERRSARTADSPPAGFGSRPDSQRGEIRFDEKGNASWHWRVEDVRIREEDPTLNLKGLDDNYLTLDEQEPASGSSGGGFNPYDKTR